MKELCFNNVNYIRNKVVNAKLSHIIIETGDRNVFIESLSKFIVKDKMLTKVKNLLAHQTFLTSIDLSKLDFKEITTMENWFLGCETLSYIKFPKKVKCPNLISLENCFARTNIEHLDLSSWKFNKKTMVNISLMVSNCKKLKTLKLPKISIMKTQFLAKDCNQLEYVNFNESQFVNLQQRLSFHLYNDSIFTNCYKLKLIDCSQMLNDNDNIITILNSENNLKNVPKTCLIILPN